MVNALRRMADYGKAHPEVVGGCEAVPQALTLLEALPDDATVRAAVLEHVDTLATSLATARLRYE